MEQTSFLLEGQKYCLDTSSIIALRQEYPQDIFGPLYRLITPFFQSGKVVVLDQVFDELKAHEPDLYKYMKSEIPPIRQLSFTSYIEVTQSLIRTYYDGKGQAHKIKADPHVIACAKAENLIIITEEMGGNPTAIPTVCRAESIEYLNLLGFFREENIKL